MEKSILDLSYLGKEKEEKPFAVTDEFSCLHCGQPVGAHPYAFFCVNQECAVYGLLQLGTDKKGS